VILTDTGSKNELTYYDNDLNSGECSRLFIITSSLQDRSQKICCGEIKEGLFRIAFAVAIFTSAVLCLIIYSSIHGNIKFSMRFILAGVGLMLAIVGNYIYNIKPNYFAGIRLHGL
jgi:hypothetical protein